MSTAASGGPRKRAGEGRAAQAAERTLDVLEFLAPRSWPVPSAEIAAACGIPRSSLHRLLQVLQQRGYVMYRPPDRGWTSGRRLAELRAASLHFSHGVAVLEVLAVSGSGADVGAVAARSGLAEDEVAGVLNALAGDGLVTAGADGTYSVGPRLQGMTSPVGWAERLRDVALPVLVTLRDASRETANLVVEDGDDALYLEQVESRYELRCAGWTGRRVPKPGTSAGAALDDPSRPHVVSDAVEAGVTAISCAAPALAPPVAVSIIGPTWRLQEHGLERLTGLVQAAAHEFAAACAVARLSSS